MSIPALQMRVTPVGRVLLIPRIHTGSQLLLSVGLPAVISSCIALLTLFSVGLWISDKIIYVYVSYLSLCNILTRLDFEAEAPKL